MLLIVLILRVLAMMAVLAPHRADDDGVAVSIAVATDSADTLYKDDPDHTKTASVMVAVAFREGTFHPHVIGDKGASYGTWQTNLPGKAKTLEGWDGALLLDDTQAAAKVALRMLRESFRACPAHPIAFYAEGPRGCTSPRGQRISADRMNLARWARGHARAVSP